MFVLSGVDLIEEHLCEIRTLRQRLEDSIRTNERLRQQLETRLANAARDGGKRNYINHDEIVKDLMFFFKPKSVINGLIFKYS